MLLLVIAMIGMVIPTHHLGYTWVDTNSVGCDSTVTLNLTINPSSSSFHAISSLDSLNWNGNTYTSSGIYTWTGTNFVGCDRSLLLI